MSLHRGAVRQDLRIRVCHLTSVHPPLDTRIMKECRSLARHGHDVHLIAPWGADREIDGVFLHGVPPASTRIRRMTRTAFSVVERARRLGADLYHLHDPELLPYSLLLPRHKPLVFDVHEDVTRQLVHKGWLPAPGLVSRLYTALERTVITLGRLRLVLAETSYLDSYRALDPKAAVVLNYPEAAVADKEAGESREGSEPRLVYVGSVSRARGLREMLELTEVLNSRGWPVSFDCVGSFSTPADEQLAREEIGRLRVGDQVRMHGRLEHHKAMEVVRGARIGLCLLHPLPNYLGSFPTKAFEYMAAGLPFVLSDFPFYRGVFGPVGCCRFANPMDPASVLRAAEEFLKSPALAREAGRRGKEAVQAQFTWASQEQVLLALYREMLGREPNDFQPAAETRAEFARA